MTTAVVGVALATAFTLFGAESDSVVADLSAAPPNTWVKIHEAETGGREQPIFVYADNIRKFVLATGMQAYGGNVPRHYDVEEFDLASHRWSNAYPSNFGEDRPPSGPVGEEYSQQRAKQGFNGPQLFYQDGDHLRVGAGGQWLNSKTYGEYCYLPDDGKIYAYMWDMTLSYDVSRRTWTDLGAQPRTACRIWGSMCYDPVNKEILHAGGDGGSTEIGTWVYSIDKNQWRELEFGSNELNSLLPHGKRIQSDAKALLGRTANRYTVTETEEESKADLAALARELAHATKQFRDRIASARLNDGEQIAAKVAVDRFDRAHVAIIEASHLLSKPVTPETIASVRATRVLFEQAVDALRPEPPGRARSQLAYDAVHQKIVLFGGDGLDRTLSDTWLYDCKTRVWQQRFPVTCPAPRAGHILAWLPKAKTIVLAGGYSRVPLAQEAWTYDIGEDQWSLLLHVPLEGSGDNRFSRDCPHVTDREFQFGAVNEDDILVCPNGTTVWACKIDPQKSQDVDSDDSHGTAGSYTFSRIDPATWEEAAEPNPKLTQKFFDQLPANQWNALEFAKYAPGDSQSLGHDGLRRGSATVPVLGRRACNEP